MITQSSTKLNIALLIIGLGISGSANAMEEVAIESLQEVRKIEDWTDGIKQYLLLDAQSKCTHSFSDWKNLTVFDFNPLGLIPRGLPRF